ncbi:MAG: PfkB family carbohydrate kinase, partial [bacterium]
HPDLQLEVLSQVTNPRLVILDTMNLWINTTLPSLKKVIQKVDAIIVNDQEAFMLTGEHNLIKAARGVSKMGPKTVVVKKGEHGAFIISDNHFFSVPAFPLEELYDPTGAGDSFAGGMVGYIAKVGDGSFDSIRKAIVYGSVTASFAVERFSIERLKSMNLTEIEERYQKFVEITRF